MTNNSALHEDSSQDGAILARTVVVSNQLGLHARPAARLAQESQKFNSEITVVWESQEVDAKSILDLLTLAAAQGSRLEIRAVGDDADNALDCIEELFKSRFGEDK